MLIETSRYPINFEGGDKIQFLTQPISPANVLFFIGHLLQLQPDPKPFQEPQQQADLASRFFKIVGPEPVTPLLLKLFVKKAVQQPDNSLDHLPESIPDIYFEYLRAINPENSGAENFLTHDRMLEAAECLGKLATQNGFVPREFLKSDARHELSQIGLGGPGQADPIERLIQNGVLQQELYGSDAQLRFALDPIAEMLGAMARGKACGVKVENWQDLENQINAQGDVGKKFGDTLRLIREAYGEAYGWPSPSSLASSAMTN